jgi:Protein of unknown function (DUF2846)
MMKTILVVLLFASPVFAQDQAPAPSANGGCGPSEAQFDVKTNDKQHPVAPAEAGKALVYVFEDMEHGPTMRVGLDGAWVGANKGKSYFFFSVDVGEHQLCTNWQSGTFKKTAKRIGSAITLKAEAGKVYYLRAQVYERTEQDRNVKLEPVESAEGQFLISASSFSTSHPKK